VAIERANAGRPPASIETDPIYSQGLGHMQLGQWMEAAEALAELERRYPASAEVHELRQRLSFHLSAEETWSIDGASRLPPPLRPVGVRILLAANLVIYALLLVGWLLGQWTGLLR
jgi:hypothetical protein